MCVSGDSFTFTTDDCDSVSLVSATDLVTGEHHGSQIMHQLATSTHFNIKLHTHWNDTQPLTVCFATSAAPYVLMPLQARVDLVRPVVQPPVFTSIELTGLGKAPVELSVDAQVCTRDPAAEGCAAQFCETSGSGGCEFNRIVPMSYAPFAPSSSSDPCLTLKKVSLGQNPEIVESSSIRYRVIVDGEASDEESFDLEAGCIALVNSPQKNGTVVVVEAWCEVCSRSCCCVPVQYSLVQYSAASQHSTWQHNTAFHSTAHGSILQYSAAYHSTTAQRMAA